MFSVNQPVLLIVHRAPSKFVSYSPIYAAPSECSANRQKPKPSPTFWLPTTNNGRCALALLCLQDITLYDYEILDVDAWEGVGTPLRVSIDVVETLGTGAHGPTVSLSNSHMGGLSFAALGAGDGLEDSSMAFVAGLDDTNAAISELSLHTTTSGGAVSASGVLSLGACDSGEWIDEADGATDVEGRAAWWDWEDGCRTGGWGGQNVTFDFRMGTMPVLETVWPPAAPVTGGLTIEVRVAFGSATQYNTPKKKPKYWPKLGFLFERGCVLH